MSKSLEFSDYSLTLWWTQHLLVFTLCCGVEDETLEAPRHLDSPPASPDALDIASDPC